jgi:AraC family transcriptional regulator
VSRQSRIVLGPGYRIERTRGPERARAPVVALDPTVVVALAGTATVAIGGAHHDLAAPALARVNPGLAFAVSARGGERLTVALRSPAVAAAAARLGLEEGAVVLFHREVAPVAGAVELSTRRLALELERGEGAGHDRMLDLAVDLFAADLFQANAHAPRESRFERSRAGLVDRRLRRSIEFMHDNFARDLSVGEIAAAAYLSEYHFARLFKRITGVTPHAYLASLRIEHAQRLLVETDLSIAEVGARVGYASASHFGKVFRETTGVAPTTFRGHTKD